MALEKTKRLIAMGRAAAVSLTRKASPQGRYDDAELWVLMNGFNGGFYAVWECLHRVEAQGEPLLNDALREWRDAGGRDAYERKGGLMRKMLSHQGKSFTTTPYMEIEEDWFNDTEHNILKHRFVTLVFDDGTSIEASFDEYVTHIFAWWDQQVLEIERLFNNKIRAAAREAEYDAVNKLVEERYPLRPLSQDSAED